MLVKYLLFRREREKRIYVGSSEELITEKRRREATNDRRSRSSSAEQLIGGSIAFNSLE